MLTLPVAELATSFGKRGATPKVLATSATVSISKLNVDAALVSHGGVKHCVHSHPFTQLGRQPVKATTELHVRTIQSVYRDPLELIWTETARELGMTIERDTTVFASWNGRGVLQIGTPETLDADDSLAQMIFHEVCHALVEGPEAFHKADWGLQIDNPAHRVHEHACLRLQAALAGPYGLRELLAATTNFRKYYDALPDDPLCSDDDPAAEMARCGWDRATAGPWSSPLQSALGMTAQIAAVVKEVAPADSLWSRTDADCQRL